MANTPFNPDIGNSSTPNFIGDQSQGAEAGKTVLANATGTGAGATLNKAISGLADIIPTLAQAGDRATKIGIDNSIYDSNDKLNREFGATDTIALNNASVPTIPGQLEDSAKNLQRVSAALNSGAISKTTFDVKVASMASDLRAQYASPYLRDYIDKKVQDVTGVDPQNQVRKDIFAQVAKNQESALEEQKQKQALVIANAKDGIAVPNWEKMSLPQVIDATAASNRIFRDQKIKMGQMDAAVKENSLVDDDMIKSGQEGVQAFAFQNIGNIFTQMGTSEAQFNAGIQAIADPNMPDDKRNQIIGGVKQLQAKVISEGRTWLLQNYKGYNLDDAKVDKILTPLKMYTQNFVDSVAAGNAPALKEYKDMIDFRKLQDDSKLMSIDGVRASAAANRNLGNIAGAAILNTHLTSIVKNADRVFATSEKNKMFGTDGGESLDQAYTGLRNNGVRDQKAYDMVTKLPTDVIKEPTSTPEAVKSAVRAAYGTDNTAFIAKLPDAQKASTYATLYSPDVTKAMERRRDAGDQESYIRYIDSAKASFGPVFRQAAMNMQQASLDPSHFSVSYDANTHQFNVGMKPSYTARGIPIQQSVPPEITLINQGLRTLTPLLESNGENAETFLNRQFQEIGLTGPQANWRQSVNPLVQVQGAFSEQGTQTQGVTTTGPSKLGGAPGSVPTSAGGADQGPQAANHEELREYYKLLDKATDPETRTQIQQHIDELKTPVENPNTKSGQPEPGLGSPDNDIVNALTGHQDFIDAVKSGDPKEVAKQVAIQAATLLPFPGSRALAKEGARAIEAGGAKVIDSTTLEALRADKGMAAQSASKAPEQAISAADRQAVIVDNAAKIIVSKNSPTQIGQKLDQLTEFKKYASSPESANFFDKEIATWTRARELLKKEIKSVD